MKPLKAGIKPSRMASTGLPHAKPAGPIKNKGQKEYDAFRQRVLARWTQERSGGEVHAEGMGVFKVRCRCAVCGRAGWIWWDDGVYWLDGLDVGHNKARSRHPELRMDYNNVMPECRACNTKHPKGGM